MKLELGKIERLLEALHACNEKIADRGPIKVLPRPPEEAPNIPVLQAQIKVLLAQLRAKRKNTTTPKGHDLDANGALLAGRDLSAIGVIEEVRTIPKGQDQALPNATHLVRVHFPAGEHVWFDADDLVATEKPPKKSPGGASA